MIFGTTKVEISNCTSTMIVVILVGIIPITSWINEEEMRVDKGFHKTGKELYMLYVMYEYPE